MFQRVEEVTKKSLNEKTPRTVGINEERKKPKVGMNSNSKKNGETENSKRIIVNK